MQLQDRSGDEQSGRIASVVEDLLDPLCSNTKNNTCSHRFVVGPILQYIVIT